MLDFLNDLKLSPNSSFVSQGDEQNLLEESVLSPFPQPFPTLENQMELEEFFSVEDNKISKSERKKMKKRRGNKKDDFDYNKYIEKELKKMDTSKLDSNRKKKLIQKIRNRMSA
jgi:hypothetical protein